ncbi:MAG: hypothetical protein ACXWZM_11315 [Solirubrobacterales bacterium]
MANPRAEAIDILGGDYEARVLEPSPPAVNEPPFADDPVAPGEVPDGRLLVSPVRHHGDLTWDDVARERPDIAGWCAERWLAAWRRLEPLPGGFAQTRAALHRIAEEVVSVERMPENEIALRFTRGGFGTPFFELDRVDCQVRVEAGELVRQRGADEDREPIEGVDLAAARALGEFYGFACSVLEEERAEEADEDPSLLQLWPEHFDLAFELGSEAKGQRANYGASPGDEDHDQPYLYVGPWDGEISGELWNATAFPGAELTYAELLAAPDQRRAALDFFHERHRALCG